MSNIRNMMRRGLDVSIMFGFMFACVMTVFAFTGLCIKRGSCDSSEWSLGLYLYVFLTFWYAGSAFCWMIFEIPEDDNLPKPTIHSTNGRPNNESKD